MALQYDRIHLDILIRRALFCLACLGSAAISALAQPFPIFNGTASTCVGAFLDSGGQGASGYSNNENYTYTLCPDAPGGAISLTYGILSE